MKLFEFVCDWCRCRKVSTNDAMPDQWVVRRALWQPERKPMEKGVRPVLKDLDFCCIDHYEAYQVAVEKTEIESWWGWSREFESQRNKWNRNRITWKRASKFFDVLAALYSQEAG